MRGEQKAVYKPDAQSARALVLDFQVSRNNLLPNASHHSGSVCHGSWSGLESPLCMEPSTSGGKQPCEPFSRTAQEGLSSVSSSWQCLQGADPPLTMESEMRSFPGLFSFQDVVPPVLLVCVFLSFFRTSLHIFLPDPASPQHSAHIPFFAVTGISLDVNSQLDLNSHSL